MVPEDLERQISLAEAEVSERGVQGCGVGGAGRVFFLEDSLGSPRSRPPHPSP